MKRDTLWFGAIPQDKDCFYFDIDHDLFSINQNFFKLGSSRWKFLWALWFHVLTAEYKDQYPNIVRKQSDTVH